MRPFRFFFFLSMGIILFLFVARLVLFALFAAAILSMIFFLGRKIKSFFQRLDWDEEDYEYPYRQGYRKPLQQPIWKDDLLVEYPAKQTEYLPNFRTIEVR